MAHDIILNERNSADWSCGIGEEPSDSSSIGAVSPGAKKTFKLVALSTVILGAGAWAFSKWLNVMSEG